MRTDISRGLQAANLVHAAGESSPGELPSGTHAVVLAAKDEQELRAIAARLDGALVPFTRVEEPDAPFHGALMAIGVRPARREEVRRHLSSLPLLK